MLIPELTLTGALRQAALFEKEPRFIQTGGSHIREGCAKPECLEYCSHVADRDAAVAVFNFGEGVERNPGTFGDD